LAPLWHIASGPGEVTGEDWGRTPVRRGVAFLLLALVFVLALFPSRGNGTEEYAERTGRTCGACHVDSSGGGELTAGGEAYLRERVAHGDSVREPSRLRHTIRFIAGFLHLFPAVMWFGTILYVHLLLKPSYAAHGLPRGELIVGWGSIILIALTGIVLFGSPRFYSPPALKRSMRASLSASFQLPSVFRMAADILCGNAQTICHAGATGRA